MSPDNRSTMTIGISLPKDTVRLLKEYCDKWEISTGQVIARIMKEYTYPIKKRPDLRKLGLNKKDKCPVEKVLSAKI